MKLVHRAVSGALAGAAGTAVLNAATYADMALRDRGPSDLPQKMASVLAQKAGVTIASENRRTAAGALLGYADGIGAGVVAGLARPMMRRVPALWFGIGLGLLTMALSEGTATAMGQTDPREWGVVGWISDVVPRCLYGWTACSVLDAIDAG